MNFFKRFLSLAASLALCSTFFSGVNSVFAASEEVYGYLTYIIKDDSTAEITRCDYTVTSVVIPETINGHSVTSIKDSIFNFREDITDITIPASVTDMCGTPFYFCDSLESINVDDNNKNYHDVDGVLFRNAFTSGFIKFEEALIQYPAGKTDKTYLIPDSVGTIADYAFDSSKLTNIIIPDSVTVIGAYSFCACPALKDVPISNSVKSIGDYAFFNCNSLLEVAIPNSAALIGEMSFGYWYNDKTEEDERKPFFTISGYPGSSAKTYANENGLTFSTLFGNLTYEINEDLEDSPAIITGCVDSAVSVDIPSVIDGHPVTSIDKFAFAYCTDLISVTIPDSVTSIENSAFSECTSLANITIPYSVTAIGDFAFFKCFSLTRIYVDSSNVNYCDIDGVLFNKDKTTLIQYPSAKPGSEYSVPDSVKSISQYAFYGCTGLRSVAVSRAVTEIGSYALGYFFNSAEPENNKIKDFTISGYTGSAAETYATTNSINFSALENPIVYGDIYIDGAVTIKDLSYLAKYMASVVTMTDEQLANADVYKDGSITVKDLSLFAKYMAQYPVKLGPQA